MREKELQDYLREFLDSEGESVEEEPEFFVLVQVTSRRAALSQLNARTEVETIEEVQSCLHEMAETIPGMWELMKDVTVKKKRRPVKGDAGQ